jgi:hypothetical protein
VTPQQASSTRTRHTARTFTLFACVHIDPCERNRRRRPRASASSEDVCPNTQANSCP